MPRVDPVREAALSMTSVSTTDYLVQCRLQKRLKNLIGRDCSRSRFLGLTFQKVKHFVIRTADVLARIESFRSQFLVVSCWAFLTKIFDASKVHRKEPIRTSIFVHHETYCRKPTHDVVLCRRAQKYTPWHGCCGQHRIANSHRNCPSRSA